MALITIHKTCVLYMCVCCAICICGRLCTYEMDGLGFVLLFYVIWSRYSRAMRASLWCPLIIVNFIEYEWMGDIGAETLSLNSIVNTEQRCRAQAERTQLCLHPPICYVMNGITDISQFYTQKFVSFYQQVFIGFSFSSQVRCAMRMYNRKLSCSNTCRRYI